LDLSFSKIRLIFDIILAYLLVNQCSHTEDMLATVKASDVKKCVDLSRLLYTYDKEKGGILFYDGKDITPYLKDYKVDHYVAIISPVAVVRELVTQAQRAFAKVHDSVIEGRDVGSVVFPNANYKFFLTADIKVRAKRWIADQAKRGNEFTLKEAIKRIKERDLSDEEREISPLVIPKGAKIINNSGLTIDETVQALMVFIKQ